MNEYGSDMGQGSSNNMMGFFVGGGPALGPFRLQIDEVRLEPK